ncbi:amidohydrolase family protein [Dethiobacter alkaliphilus]|uniref:Amidohydrolase n=1 Tax=Dethiobacter alkaliphilus AHT 1 TaxID=555088 RepID=C0GHS6_DETAL|nr:amidohydrolase family protein [Dethiobacter alkaliphilus]EEG77000.1 amidohydrolase [Dethiobacter alkaliphilus AHT 1]
MQIISIPAEATIKYGAAWDGFSDSLSGPGSIHYNNSLISDSPAIRSAVLDYTKHTVMPALIDCHVHLNLPTKNNDTPVNRANKFLQSGIAAVREAGSPPGTKAPLSPLKVINTIQAIYRSGCYGSNLGTSVEDVSAALHTIDRLADSGAGQIKIIASGIFSFTNYGETGAVPFTTNELTRMVTHAKAAGLKVMAHATGDEAVQRCLEAGVDTIEHGYFISEETLHKMAENDTAWIPTLIPAAIHLLEPKLSKNLSAHQRETLRRTLERHRQLVAKAAGLNVCIGAGTDAGAVGVPHGPSLLWEITQLISCGLTNVAALKSATSHAARICGFSGYGKLTPGQRSPVLVLEKNPLKQITTLQEPVALLIPS